MNIIRDRILQALYGSALIATSLGATACGVDELPQDANNNATNVTPTGTNSSTSATNNNTSTAPPSCSSLRARASIHKGSDLFEVTEGQPGVDMVAWVCRRERQPTPCKPASQMSQREKSDFVSMASIEVGYVGVCGTPVARFNPDGGMASADSFCGPLTNTSESLGCCYSVDVLLEKEICFEGRPFTIEGIARTASVAESEGWLSDVSLGDLDDVDAVIREAAARSWAQSGLHEHASIASFSRFLLDLMSLGAPRDLVAATTQAIHDEINHAADCFAIASAYAGQALGPDDVEMTNAMQDSGDLEAILEAAIMEGCIGETLAACVAQWQLSHTSLPELTKTLQKIALDEADHAILAWRFVAWVIEEHPHLRAFAHQVFARELAPSTPLWAYGFSLRDAAMLEHGVVSEALRAQVCEHALFHTIAPCVEQLFGQGAPTQSVGAVS